MNRPRFLADHDLNEDLVLVWSDSELEEWKDQVVFLPFVN